MYTQHYLLHFTHKLLSSCNYSFCQLSQVYINNVETQHVGPLSKQINCAFYRIIQMLPLFEYLFDHFLCVRFNSAHSKSKTSYKLIVPSSNPLFTMLNIR